MSEEGENAVAATGPRTAATGALGGSARSVTVRRRFRSADDVESGLHFSWDTPNSTGLDCNIVTFPSLRFNVQECSR